MNIKEYKLYLIDLDGTIYNGDKEIEFAKEFINYLNDEKIDYLFLTNNSTREPKDVVNKLKKLGVSTELSHIYTSSEATKTYLQSKSYKKIYIIGEEGLKNTLGEFEQLENEKDSEAVVVGLDRKLTYEKLTVATRAVLNGAELIGTNPDTLLPTAEGFIPSNGGQIKYLEHATSKKATIIGKPSKIIMECAMSLFDYKKNDIVMIGDNYATDIMSGINSNIDTIHVQTGVTSLEDLKMESIQPTYTIKNLSQLIKKQN